MTGNRFSAVFPNALQPTSLRTLVDQVFLLAGPIFFLLAGLYINRKIGIRFPALWLIIPVFLAAVMASTRYIEAEKPVVRLWQLVGSLSAVYALLHYPLLPLQSDDNATVALDGLVLFVWLASLAAGVLCFKIPSLSVLPPSFLLWSKSVAGTITGLPQTAYIDVAPLPEVSICIAIGLLINQIHSYPRDDADILLRSEFAKLLCLFAISIHLANYFWSFYIKATLDGPPLAWLWENNPAYIFLVALDNGHILFSAYQDVVAFTFTVIDQLHLISNFGILFAQAAAITAFFLTKRAFVILLLLFDAMHLSIILVVGANFWPWIVLNVIITYVVAGRDFQQAIVAHAADKHFDARAMDFVLRLLATGFILIAPRFVNVTFLGWYDTGANNKLFFEAVDELGGRHYVPTNYFTFYSYSLAHMDYGSPEPATAFATGSPNGGAWEYKYFKAGRTCDVNALRGPDAGWPYRDELSVFVRNYHRLALKIYSTLGVFPYNVYPHHFHVPGILTEDFDRLEKRHIVAYIYRRESVCVTFNSGQLKREVKDVAEYRIDVGERHNDK
jgi:hypothetical protein